tara:strand:+ start:171 stop:422 length:252 start_codon:yes stop_codon:yes gene_type:complete
MPETDKQLISSLIDAQKENVKCLRDIHGVLERLMEKENNEHQMINTNMTKHMAGLLALIFLLVVGLFALVNIKLQYPGIPVVP